MPSLEMVCVKWVDAIFSKDEPVPPITLHSMGFLIENNDDHITIAMETDGDKSRDFLTIPEPYVKQVIYLSPRAGGDIDFGS